MCETQLRKGLRAGAGRRWWLKVLASLALATANTVTPAGFASAPASL